MTTAERDEFVAMLNDRRLILAVETGRGAGGAAGTRQSRSTRSTIAAPRFWRSTCWGHFIMVLARAADLTGRKVALTCPPFDFNRADYDGFIFDCDGTLADSMPLHYRAWTETLADKLGRPATEFTEELFYRFGGMPAREIMAKLDRDFGWSLPAEATAHEKEERFLALLPGVGPVPEVMAALHSLGADARVAVASGGMTAIVRDTLRHIGLEVGPGHAIQHLIGSDQVSHGKPKPDLFLLAAEKLGVAPARCLVFEDAEPGFQAARAAGMAWVDVRPHRANLRRAAIY